MSRDALALIERYAMPESVLAALDAMLVACPIEPVRAGTPVCEEGRKADSLYVLLEGSLIVSRRDARMEDRELAVAHGPAILGHMALVTGSNRTATLTAQGEVRLGRLPKAEFDRLQVALTPEGDALRRMVLSAMLDQQRRAVGDVARRLSPPKDESPEDFGAGPTGWSV
jgi:CRP-like cAMP-binding protein